MIGQESNRTKEFSITHPRIPSSMTALYCKGISMRAARAKAVSFWAGVVFLDIISVKLTNCTEERNTKLYFIQIIGILNVKFLLLAPKPGSCQSHVWEAYHQISSYLPKVHHQHQREQSIMGMSWNLKRKKQNPLL